MAKVFIWCPFYEFKLPNQFRTNPATVLHLLRGQTQAPAPGSLFWQICKRTFRDFQCTKALMQLLSQYWGEPVASPACIKELCAFVIAEDHRVEVPWTDCVAANDKFLTFVDPHFAPGARTSTRLIEALQVFRNNTLKPLRPHRLNDIGET